MIEAATLNPDGTVGTKPIGLRPATPARAAARVLKALEPEHEPLFNAALLDLACQLAGQEAGGVPFCRLAPADEILAERRWPEIRRELAAMEPDELRVLCTGLGAAAYVGRNGIQVGAGFLGDAEFAADVETCTVGRVF